MNIDLRMPYWRRNRSIRAPLLALAAIELLVPYLSVLGAAILLFGSIGQSESAIGHLNPKAAVVAVMILVSLVSMGLYNFHQRIHFGEVLVRVAVGMALGTLGLAAVYFVFPSVSLPREYAAVVVLMSLVIVLFVRLYFFHNVDTNIFRRRTLIYGSGKRAASIDDLRRRADRRGFKIVGMVPVAGDAQISQKNVLLDAEKSLEELSEEYKADEIVIALDDRRGNLPVRELFDCIKSGVDVIDLMEFLERESGKIRVDIINPSWLIFSPGFRTTPIRRFGKRVFDLSFSLAALAVAWPIMLLVAIAIKLFDGLRAPVLYRQYRVGYKGANFPIMKFRSMVENAETDSGAVWAEENDPRITPIGRFIRKTRLDELPQLINVLRGEMSLVGPRPERPEFVDTLAETIPYYLERHAVKPGITGWAQLRYPYGSSEGDAIQKLQYDLYYVKNQSFILDIIILLQTLEVVVWRKGSR